ncbi:MAG: transposase [Alphaproteobacteria bacterium]|nr:transposase [Alphaproteobacteria bacterium]
MEWLKAKGKDAIFRDRNLVGFAVRVHTVEVPKRRPGRPRRGEGRPKALSRFERQANGMSLNAMLDDLPKLCDRGTKRNARGILETWRGYKLHIDTADCCVPLSAILASASVHDSQAAIPLATMTAGRVVNLYDLMDAAYGATEIHPASQRLGHVPVIDTNPRRDKALKEARNREAQAQRAAGHPDARTNRPIPHPHRRRED